MTVTSFGFKYELPWTPTWWSTSASCPTRTGCRSCGAPRHDPAVRDYVLAQDGTSLFLARLEALLETAMPKCVSRRASST